MKRSLLIIISMILACLMLLASCGEAASNIKDDSVITQPDADASVEDEKADEDPLQPDADVKLEAEPEADAKDEPGAEPDVEIKLETEETPAEDVKPEADEKLEADEEITVDEPIVNEDEYAEGYMGVTDAPMQFDDGMTTYAGISDSNILKSNSFKGILYYKATNGKTIASGIDLTMDYKYFIDGNNNTYSQDIAKLSALLASDVYDDVYVKLTEGAATGGNDTPTTFGKLLGLKDAKFYKLTSSSYSVDKNDITDFLVGHRKIVRNGKTYEVIIVSVRGTNATNAEWSSNFDVGADTQEYYSAMGSSHPHWKNKQNHKGFDVTANRVYEKLSQYISTYVNSNAETSILVTGHSRGAAVANILGQMLEDKTSYKTFGYTFATPNTTTAKNATTYKNIFNIVNEDDIIPYLPNDKWGFTKYGITRTISVKEAYSGSKTGSFKWFTGLSYNDDGGTQRTLDCFAALANSRADLYKLDTTSAGKFYYAGNFALGYSQKDAAKKYDSLVADLKAQNLLQFCTVKIVEGGTVWKYRVEVNYSPAYFMQMLANMTTGVGPLLGHDLTGKYNDAKLSFVASSGKVVIGGMEHPHMQPTYYLIVRNDF